MRTDECVICGARFVIVPRHPMVTNDHWCPACRERLWNEVLESVGE